MNSFNYFIPDAKPEDIFEGQKFHPELFARDKHILGPALHDIRDWPADATVIGVRKGPSQCAGVVLAPSRPNEESPELVGYFPNKQTWRPILSDGDSKAGPWIGWPVDDPPGHDDLKRRQTFAGYAVGDASETPWTIPVVRPKPGGQGTLPHYYEFQHTAAGVETIARLKPEYGYLDDLAGKLWEFFVGDELTMDSAELVAAAVTILGVNYRIGPAELSVFASLGKPVLDDRMVQGILHAALDGAVFAELMARELEQFELKPNVETESKSTA